MMEMDKAELVALAEELGMEGQRGWLTHEGEFFEADETPAVRIAGLELGGHEKAALEWLELRDPKALEDLERERFNKGFVCWEETDGFNVIKKFMFSRGFVRVAPDCYTGE
jgi:hypothetical protein